MTGGRRRGSRSSKTGCRESRHCVAGMEFTLYRKKVKNINLRIRPDGDVHVSAPLRAKVADIEAFVASRADWIRSVRAKNMESPFGIASHASEEEKQRWKEVVSATVPVLVEKWEGVLGVKTSKLVFRNMTSRWGSCQPSTGRICINTRLALYPPECLDYVVAHELCHMLVKGHGSDFHALMDRIMPDWRQRRAKLR